MAESSAALKQNLMNAVDLGPVETFDSQESAATFMERLSEQDRRALMSKARQERHAPGSVLCREGEPGAVLYIVEAGQIAVLKEAENGQSSLLGYRGTGEIIGEMSLLGKQPRSATVVVARDAKLLRIDATDFQALMDAYPGISRAILNVLSGRLIAADVARTAIIHKEQNLVQQVENLTGETLHLAELAQVRQETIELIAHDLRTPLAVLDGCLQLLETSLPAEALDTSSDIVKLAKHSSRRLMALLDELLSSARHSAMDSIATGPRVDLDSLLRTIIEGARITADRAELSLHAQIADGLPSPRADEGQLERVVENLLDNAMAYTPPGGHIIVAAREINGQVEISVSDSGPGIPAKHRELIFERFTRVPGMEGRKQGFGLGLYFCRQVILAHGGRIWVESGPQDEGSRFVFTLPIDT